MKHNSIIHFLLLAVLALIWGSSYILMKKGLTSFSPEQVAFLRIVFSMIILVPFGFRSLKHIQRKDIKYMLFIAVLGSGIPSYLYPLSVSKIASSVAGIVNALTPLFTFLFGILFFRTKTSKGKLYGTLLGLLGALFLVVNNNSDDTTSSTGFVLLAVLATICYGLSSNLLKAKLDHVNAVALTAGTFLMIGPIALIALLCTDFVDIMKTDTAAFSSLMYIALLGVLGTAFALVLFNYLIKRTNALFASAVTYLIPIVAIFWGVIDGEAISLYHFAGLVFILSGVYLISKKVKKQDDESMKENASLSKKI